ncbi:hypothetical protein L6164_018896 [Bauhinia variegata]|uniref:Uncharacterized protein n=1 Tax=Bauhinia variegata TaxID=167791 RepID=A0ACB9NHK9_BAUVA|nr:hypothetical protein L6164_018896 [Bauhinia variegata]
MAEIEVPQYFACPISLQIMKDPVTAVTGITYDRESIEQWLMTAKDCTCPVTKQPLPRDSDLTPNHTLRRLIQAWCSGNGVDRIPTPKTPLNKTHFQKLIRDLELTRLHQNALEKLYALATENERNRKHMAEAGVANAMVPIVIKCFKQGKTSSLEEALVILRLLWSGPTLKPLVDENLDLINALTWILQLHVDNNVKLVNEAMPILNSAIEISNSTLLGNLKLEFFKEITRVLRSRAVSHQAVKSALHALIETCPLGRNRMKIVEAGAVFELIELELTKPEKNITELIFVLLAHLCSCADGREQFLRHGASFAVLSKRILRVSPTTDDRAVHTLSMIAKYSASADVVSEMLKVGAVSKLCMVMQADCASYIKEKARGILRLHSKTWNNSPCIQVYLLTRHQR